ncbi:MAG: alpha/beta hydrolase [Nocardioides sp.]
MNDAARVAGPAVVFLPGVGQIPTDWQEQVTQLPDGWRGFVPWLPGLKPTDKQGFDLDRAVGEMLLLLDTNSLPKAHFVGLSLGAAVALRIAAHHPDRVDRLVLASGQVSPPKMVMKLQLALMRRTSEEKFRAQGVIKDRAIAAVETLARLDLRADLKRVSAPTLVLTGTGDLPNRAAAKALTAGIAGARSVALDGGHALNEANPEGFNREVFGFLQEA